MIRKKSLITLLTICSLLLVGCATGEFGQPKVDDFGAFLELEKGKTTKEEVYEVFGQPYKVTENDLDETTWTYFSAKTTYGALTAVPVVNIFAGGSNVYATIATFAFNAGGVLIGSERGESVGYFNNLEGLGSVGRKAQYESVVERVRIEMEKLGLPYDAKLAESQAVNADTIAEIRPE